MSSLLDLKKTFSRLNFPANTRSELEERRLFYIALTRAEKKCLYKHALNTSDGDLTYGEPSRFVRKFLLSTWPGPPKVLIIKKYRRSSGWGPAQFLNAPPPGKSCIEAESQEI